MAEDEAEWWLEYTVRLTTALQQKYGQHVLNKTHKPTVLVPFKQYIYTHEPYTLQNFRRSRRMYHIVYTDPYMSKSYMSAHKLGIHYKHPSADATTELTPSVEIILKYKRPRCLYGHLWYASVEGFHFVSHFIIDPTDLLSDAKMSLSLKWFLKKVIVRKRNFPVEMSDGILYVGQNHPTPTYRWWSTKLIQQIICRNDLIESWPRVE